MSTAVYATVLAILAQRGVAYEAIEHPAVTDCEDSARYRAAAGWPGAEDWRLGSKCLLFHVKKKGASSFHLVVTHAGREVNGRRFKKVFGSKDMRFATPEELAALTGCAPGSVAPFGHVPEAGREPPHLYLDTALLGARRFYFNPGLPTMSLSVAGPDLALVYGAAPGPVTLFDVPPEAGGAGEAAGRENLGTEVAGVDAGANVGGYIFSPLYLGRRPAH